jgi:2-desacetyl-2-hydroxyethyl bacteriochlorophyllide A dehydrogenase
MKAIEFRPDRTAHLVEVDIPEAGVGEVVVRVTSAGICGSDLTALAGRHPFRIPPLISGHEAGGVVVEVGDRVEGWLPGDRVAIEPQLACGGCAVCDRGDYHLCPSKVMLGIAAWPGALAESVRVPSSTLHRLPDAVDDELAALVEPMAVAVHAVRQAPAIDGLDVIVLGGGTIGVMTAHQARRSGAASVTVTDPRPGNRAMALAVGADAHDPSETDWDRIARARTREGAFDIAIVATAAPGIVDEAIALVRPRGTVVQVGLFGEPEHVRVSALQMAEKRLIGSNVYDRQDMASAIEAIAEAPEAIRTLITHRGDLAAAARYLTRKVAGADDDVVKYVVLPGRAANED